MYHTCRYFSNLTEYDRITLRSESPLQRPQNPPDETERHHDPGGQFDSNDFGCLIIMPPPEPVDL